MIDNIDKRLRKAIESYEMAFGCRPAMMSITEEEAKAFDAEYFSANHHLSPQWGSGFYLRMFNNVELFIK